MRTAPVTLDATRSVCYQGIILTGKGFPAFLSEALSRDNEDIEVGEH
jgi:hypothetical protein